MIAGGYLAAGAPLYSAAEVIVTDRWTALPLLALAGCWVIDRPPLADGPHPWQPLADAPDGWELAAFDLPIACPDGEPAPALLVRPRDDSTERPVALIVHEGAFDYPLPATDTDGEEPATWRTPSRLTAAWAARHAAAALGTWAPDDASGPSTGALPAELASRGIATLVVGNCFGDLGAGRGVPTAGEGFARSGAQLAVAAWTLIASPQAGAPDLGLTPLPGPLIGLGNSGRGVTAILRSDLPGPPSLLIDSVPDDLSPYYDDRPAWPELSAGLDRIWPAGRAAAAADAIAAAPWPDFVAVVWSSEDPTAPAATMRPLADLAASRDAFVLDTTQVRHVQSAADPLVARQAIAALFPPPDEQDTDQD